MKHYFKHYLLLIAMAICGIPLSAQTPYDSFAPQAYSPILDWDSIQALQKQEVAEEFTLQEDTIVLTPCLAAIDTAEQLVLLVDTLQNMLVCTPLTDKLVRWLSVDPMADDYLHISPYAYCVWNPVRHIDPDGRDVWDIDQNGNIINHIKDTSKDAFYIVQQDNDGNYQRMTDDNGKELCMEFEYGTIEKQKTVLATKGYFDMYQIRGDRQATQLFEFFARSTGVEWCHVKTGIAGEKGLNFITTSHQDAEEYGMLYVFRKRLYSYTIREWNHNHPKNTIDPSGSIESGKNKGDIQAANYVDRYLKSQGFPIPKYHIYTTKHKKYTRYESTIK